MSFSSVLGGVGSAAKKVGSAAMKSVMPEQVQAQPAGPPAPEAPQEEPTHQFKLPDLDPSDPDYEEKKAVHDAFDALNRQLTEAAPHIDFQKEYAGLYKKQQEGPNKVPSMNPLSSFAIAMGAGQQGLNNVAREHDRAQGQEDDKFSSALDLQKAAIQGDIEQKMQQGKFKQALAQSEVLARLEATTSRIRGQRTQANEMEKIKEQNKGKLDVAHIKADSAQQQLQTRMSHLADAYKLQGEVRKAFFQQMFRALATRMTQQDVTGQQIIDQNDLNDVLGQALDWAEEHSGEDLSQPHPLPRALTPSTSSNTPGGASASPSTPTMTPDQKALAEIRAANKTKK